MRTLLLLLTVLPRLVRPVRGLHAAPRAVRGHVRAQAGTRRVRSCARPVLASGPGRRRTALAAAVPVVDAASVAQPAALVRGVYVAHEARAYGGWRREYA